MGPKGEIMFLMLNPSSSGGLSMLFGAVGSYLFSKCLYNLLSAPAALPGIHMKDRKFLISFECRRSQGLYKKTGKTPHGPCRYVGVGDPPFDKRVRPFTASSLVPILFQTLIVLAQPERGFLTRIRFHAAIDSTLGCVKVEGAVDNIHARVL